ncbi:MAG: DUF1365 domain-containing protein [Moraxellaceae bacterium]|nr:DUF1365 domain-containing protein [Moraxellaceae bacterium]MDZ4387123.1 DUF1365 domain-containing protein [Moraxellaceae bacterium]
MSNPWLYRGRVGHARLGELSHSFGYQGFYLCFPLSRRFEMRSRLFSLNRWNIFSFYDADHGDGYDPKLWISSVLEQHGLGDVDGEVYLHTMPRLFGYVFNPVSFWFCHDSNNQLKAILCEVNNTFHEKHGYLLSNADGSEITADSELSSQKVFHVSPFFPVDGEYRFRFELSPNYHKVSIDYWREGRLSLKTYVAGKPEALNDSHIIQCVLSFGWATVMVVARIHWQALKLWRKGAQFHRKPTPPALEITK